MLGSSLAMYSAEHDAQPEAFENAFSGIWWSVSTVLTVGYGDIYPITISGRILAIIIAFLGVCVVAVPTGIISAGFVEKFSQKENSDRRFHDIREVGEIFCDKKCELTGLTIKDITDKYDIRVYMIIRGELPVVPVENIKTEENDILVVNSGVIVKQDRKNRKNRKG